MDQVEKEKKEIEKEDSEKPIIARTPYDLQRLKLEKLMKNPVSILEWPLRLYLINSKEAFINDVLSKLKLCNAYK